LKKIKKYIWFLLKLPILHRNIKHIVNYLTIKLSIVMKKLMSLLVAVALVAFMTACGGAEETTSQDQVGQQETVQQEVVEQPVQEATQEVPAEEGQATEETEGAE
jgi:hypothetical protein